jgi:hypothetical protein
MELCFILLWIPNVLKVYTTNYDYILFYLIYKSGSDGTMLQILPWIPNVLKLYMPIFSPTSFINLVQMELCFILRIHFLFLSIIVLRCQLQF